MNNYISLNLVSGKLGRFSGGGKPRFILGEQNDVQLYFLDFNHPTTYPTDALGDAFSEITTRNLNSETITINAGKRGDSKILSTSSFFNLPNNFATGISIQQEVNVIPTLNYTPTDDQVSFTGIISLQPIPEDSSLFRITSYASATKPNAPSFPPLQYNASLTSPYFSFNNPSEASGIIEQNILSTTLHLCDFLSTSLPVSAPYKNISQISEYSFSFQFIYVISMPSGANFSLSASLDASKATANYGKYGYLDFSSPSWDAIIGTKNEAQIWMEAMIGDDTIAQGDAIIFRKMT